MAEKYCINHTDRPAVGNCVQCHKPLCEECRYGAIPDKVFCGRECYDRYVAYQGRRQPVVKQAGRLKSVIVGLVILAVVAAGAIFIGGALGIPVLESIRNAIVSRR